LPIGIGTNVMPARGGCFAPLPVCSGAIRKCFALAVLRGPA